MKKVLFLLTGFLISGTLAAQQSPVEELDSLYYVARNYDDAKKDSLRIVGKELRRLGDKFKLPQGELYALRFEGWADEYDGNYDLAIAKYLELREKALLAKDDFSSFMALNDMSGVYIHTQRYEKAQEVIMEGIQTEGLRKNHPRRLSTFYNNLGITYKKMGNRDSAAYAYQQSLEIKKELNDKRGMADLRINLTSLLVAKGRFEEAEKYTLQNLDYLKDKDLKADLWINLNNMGGIKIGQKRYAEALDYLNRSLVLAEELGSSEREMETRKHLAILYEETGRPAQALENFKKADALQEEIVNLETNARISELQEQFEAKEREAENALLSTQLSSELQNRRFLLVGLALALISVAAIAFALQKNRKKNKQLAHQNRLIAEQKDKLTELNTEKNNLISIVSHDLRTPFNSILLWNSTLRENLSTSAFKVAESSEMIEKMAQYGQDMINQILDIEQLEINNHQIDVQSVPIAPLLTDLINDFAPAAKGKNIQIVAQNQLPIGTEFQTDPTLLRRALENLISNALKYSNSHSKVWVSASQSRNKMRFEVKDVGPGISKDEQKQLFKKYGKTSATPTAGEASTGLGLSIVKRIMDELGGRVSVESIPGKGSTFRLEFTLG
ncbi:ATP-binding protein [Jiulongibacter sp. NS-SX5]|uniref:ATP-binding protein n=1 Tax=Jiulongibacter sp. NS-SX5 TaxID=3463854 RepID=UPI00405827C9